MLNQTLQFLISECTKEIAKTQVNVKSLTINQKSSIIKETV